MLVHIRLFSADGPSSLCLMPESLCFETEDLRSQVASGLEKLFGAWWPLLRDPICVAMFQQKKCCDKWWCKGGAVHKSLFNLWKNATA